MAGYGSSGGGEGSGVGGAGEEKGREGSGQSTAAAEEEGTMEIVGGGEARGGLAVELGGCLLCRVAGSERVLHVSRWVHYEEKSARN